MILERFSTEKFYILENWVTDPWLLFQFGGPGFRFPLTIMQMNDHLYRYPERKIYYVLDDEGNYFGYGEIIPTSENIPRLGRLLIGDPSKRGKGLGTTMISELIEETKRLYNSNAVDLYVLELNEKAIALYHKLGFYTLEGEGKDLTYNGEPFMAKKMRKDL